MTCPACMSALDGEIHRHTCRGVKASDLKYRWFMIGFFVGAVFEIGLFLGGKHLW